MRASGNIAGAIGVLRTMSAKQPDNTRVLALLGDSLMESGDATEAHAMYRKLYCDYAADFNVSRQIQRMLEVAGGRLSMHGWPVHAFPSHRQPPARPSSPRENRSYHYRPPPHAFCSVIHTSPFSFRPHIGYRRWCSYQPRHRLQKPPPLRRCAAHVREGISRSRQRAVLAGLSRGFAAAA